MRSQLHDLLSTITTLDEMTSAFRDEWRCRELLESLVWPQGRICPDCGFRISRRIMGRDMGKRARPGLYQCLNGDCRYQFTVTTRTPLHSTKLPLRLWLTGLWLILQSDKGISSVRLGEALGISQPAAWRMGHALRLLVAQQRPLEGIVEADDLHLGGSPRKSQSDQIAGPKRGRKGRSGSAKFPALAMVERPADLSPGSQAGGVRAAVVKTLSHAQAIRVMEHGIAPDAHLMTDSAALFNIATQSVAAHDTVLHSEHEYVRGIVHVNTAEGFNARVRRTIAGVFHHISPAHADLYFHEMGFRWSQRIVDRQVTRRTRKGREVARVLWKRVTPAMQLVEVFRNAVGRQMRRTKQGGIRIQSTIAVFG